MTPSTNDNSIEFEITPADLAFLREKLALRSGSLSAFEAFDMQPTQAGGNPALMNEKGEIKPHLLPVLETLAKPSVIASLNAICEGGLVDMVVYHAPTKKAASLTHADNKLWLQFPAPIPGVLEVLKNSLARNTSLEMDFTFSKAEAFVFWSLLDILHQRSSEDLLQHISVGDLLQVYDLPFDGLNTFAPYYRDSLQIPMPTPDETREACASLVDRALIGKMGQSYLPSEDLLLFARELKTIHWHAVIKTIKDYSAEEAVMMRMWMMQADSGFGLVWYETEGDVTIRSRPNEELINTIGGILSTPESIYQVGSQAANI